MPLIVESHLDLELFQEWDDASAAVADLLRAAVRRNRRYMRRHPDCPSPFERDDAGRYRYRYKHAHANDAGVTCDGNPREHIRSVPEILEAEGSDCDGLLCWIVAYQQTHGDPRCRVFVVWRRGAPPHTAVIDYHVQRKNGDGSVADDCVGRGM